jgi:peptide/nickel transport system substrate-binding protein
MGNATTGRAGALRRAVWAMLAVIVAVGLVATGCGPSEDTSTPGSTERTNAGVQESDETPIAGGKIAYGLAAETNGWNPSASQWASSGHEVARSIFDTLSAYDIDSKIQPNVAEAFTPSDDFMQWTITMRPGVKLHSGKEVTGETVKANQEFLMASTLTGAAYEPVESFNLDPANDLNVIVKMKRPWVNYPYALATQIGVVSDQDWLASGNSDHPVGTGPFSFESWTPGDKLVVRKNQDYWRDGLPYLDEVEFRVVVDDTSRSSALRTGDLDIMQTGSATELAQFKEDVAGGAEYQVFEATTGETSEVLVQTNGMAAPFDDVDARRALSYATDKDEFIEVVAGGRYEPANGPFAPSSPWYIETDYPQYDPVKAQELVDKVKAKNGGSFAFELVGPPTPDAARAMQFLQQQWAEFGIDVTPTTIEQAPLIVKILTGAYQATMWTQFDSPHPLGDSIWWHPNTATEIPIFALNFARNKDERIGDALDAAREEPDPAKEKALYQDVQEYLAEDNPYIWLYHTQLSIVAQPNVVNVVNYKLPPNQQGEERKGLPIQFGSHPLYQVWLRPAP